jgi:uncharacterized protein YndB with AHSA1/START domain
MPGLTGSFTVPLDLPAPPDKVWPLFAELPLRKKWVRMPGPSSSATHELDFRVGGSERLTNTFTSDDRVESLDNRSTFFDIIPNERIIFGYQAIVDDLTRWVALATVVLTAHDGGTHLEWTEQYSFVNVSTPGGVDDVKHLAGGTRLRLNGLLAALTALPALG